MDTSHSPPEAAEGAAVACPTELTDGEREAVHKKEPAVRHHDYRGKLLPQQFCRLEQGTPCPVKTAPAAEVREKVPVVPSHEGIPCVFGINPDQFAAQADGNDLRIGQLGILDIPPQGNFRRRKAAVQVVNNDINS